MFQECAIDINTTSTDVSDRSFLVESSGSFTNNLKNAWGISYGACMTLCGSGWEAFDLCFFLTSVSSWVLPWLALTAHLPYERKKISTDLVSVLLAVGSPMLIMYSLYLTVLNSSWINNPISCFVWTGVKNSWASSQGHGGREGLFEGEPALFPRGI